MATQTTESSLDELAKGLATGTLSRGKAIRWMGGALLGAALASVPGMAWADDCRRLGRECRRDSQCCSKNCVRWGDHKVCGCPEGKTRCGVRCVNLDRNERHCGSCFNRCPEGSECAGGVCQGDCPSGTTLCGGACVSNVCPEGQFFNTSACECQCLGGRTLCGGNCVARCPSGQTLNCSTCQCEASPCSSDFFGTALCGGECVRSDCSSGTHLNCSSCLCEGGPCPSGSALALYPDHEDRCCVNALVCGTGGGAQCCQGSLTCVNGFCR